MRQGQISIYYGMGKGKTAVAVGRGMRAIGEEQRVVMIQFLDYHNSKEIALLKKLEPDFRIFRFEKDRAAEDVQQRLSWCEPRVIITINSNNSRPCGGQQQKQKSMHIACFFAFYHAF